MPEVTEDEPEDTEVTTNYYIILIEVNQCDYLSTVMCINGSAALVVGHYSVVCEILLSLQYLPLFIRFRRKLILKIFCFA
jgi:hypothetical protein